MMWYSGKDFTICYTFTAHIFYIDTGKYDGQIYRRTKINNSCIKIGSDIQQAKMVNDQLNFKDYKEYFYYYNSNMKTFYLDDFNRKWLW